MIESWPDSAVELMNSARVMTIATYSAKGSWSAPVYYIYRKRRFYFFSNSGSRHIMNTGIYTEISKKMSMAGVSIFSDSSCFDNIKGIQMAGTIDHVMEQREAFAAAGDYIKKFRIHVGGKNGLQFITRHFHASLYKFIPESVHFSDNSMGFGFREQLMP